MKAHPVTNEGRTDHRYSVQKEFCGYPEARFVARFCDEWIGQSPSYPGAVLLAVGHKSAMRGGIITAKEVSNAL